MKALSSGNIIQGRAIFGNVLFTTYAELSQLLQIKRHIYNHRGLKITFFVGFDPPS